MRRSSRSRRHIDGSRRRTTPTQAVTRPASWRSRRRTSCSPIRCSGAAGTRPMRRARSRLVVDVVPVRRAPRQTGPPTSPDRPALRRTASPPWTSSSARAARPGPRPLARTSAGSPPTSRAAPGWARARGPGESTGSPHPRRSQEPRLPRLLLGRPEPQGRAVRPDPAAAPRPPRDRPCGASLSGSPARCSVDGGRRTESLGKPIRGRAGPRPARRPPGAGPARSRRCRILSS